MDDENRKVLVKNPGRVALGLAGAGLVVTLALAVVLAEHGLEPSQAVVDCLAVHGFELNPASDSAVYAAALEHCGG